MDGINAKGSILHLLYGSQFDTIDKVKNFLDEDPFVKNGGEIWCVSDCYIPYETNLKHI